ncbi:tyrosine-specific transport system [Rhodamnia argentea]|uniref:Tyrosine-specific transport system n=1 Tax=Rhodamnia argentea TaxID=178133 RepID=A0A8B8NU63_9MYRT|nr:tyrosine-specific transport system [Rhodamnia argentea]
MHLSLSSRLTNSITASRSNHPRHNFNHPRTTTTHLHNLFIPDKTRLHNPPPSLTKRPIFTLKTQKSTSVLNCADPSESLHLSRPSQTREQTQKKSFWGAVSLIVGTAVGPGMLGLPALTIKSGPFPSTIAILLSWLYVVSSIVLVAELTFAAMEEDGVVEVSFTGLATKALGNSFGALVAIVYASLSFSLVVACVSGIGSIVSQWFPWMDVALAFGLVPLAVGVVIGFFPFYVIDAANRLLCFVMLMSISTLVGIGMSVARSNVIASFSHASWSMSSILPAIPVMVLTLGFHVITPFICKIAGNSVRDAKKAILIGGFIPLIMVLSWNLIVLGLSGTNPAASPGDPISLLLSVKSSALSAVQGFAFSALATSLIGYAVSFPKQLVDTLDLIFQNNQGKNLSPALIICDGNGAGRVGSLGYSRLDYVGNPGIISFSRLQHSSAPESYAMSSIRAFDSIEVLVLPVVLGASVLIASFFRSTFSRALDFAGVYANCFLFGILPPLMAYIQQSRRKLRLEILPGGNVALLLLFIIAVVLGIWH